LVSLDLKIKPGFRVIKVLIQNLGLVINATRGAAQLQEGICLEWLSWSVEDFFVLRGWAQMPQKATW